MLLQFPSCFMVWYMSLEHGMRQENSTDTIYHGFLLLRRLCKKWKTKALSPIETPLWFLLQAFQKSRSCGSSFYFCSFHFVSQLPLCYLNCRHPKERQFWYYFQKRQSGQNSDWIGNSEEIQTNRLLQLFKLQKYTGTTSRRVSSLCQRCLRLQP